MSDHEPQFSTAWEREDYRRSKIGLPPLGPFGNTSAVTIPHPTAADADTMARALIAKYREMLPGAGWSTLEMARELLSAALTVVPDRRALAADTTAAKADLNAEAVKFVARWAWDKSGTTDAERLSVIKYYPTIKAAAGYDTHPAPPPVGGDVEGVRASWRKLDDEGNAELLVAGKRITSFPSYPAAEEAANRINSALSQPTPAPKMEGRFYVSSETLARVKQHGTVWRGHISTTPMLDGVALEPAPVSENVAGLVEALKDARAELLEASDKFWVIHCNHPGKVCGRGQEEDKQFLAKMHERMIAAYKRIDAALSHKPEGR